MMDSMETDITSGTPPIQLQFEDNRLVPLLFGAYNEHLARIEEKLDISVIATGNRIAIHGRSEAAEAARICLSALYDRLERGLEIQPSDVDAAIRLAEADTTFEGGGDGATKRVSATLSGEEVHIRTRKRVINPRSAGQRAYVEALNRYELVFGLGPAGTGKTYLAVAKGVSLLLEGTVERLILSRPAVEAGGERLGFLPGDMRDKVDPYMRPLYDALHDMLPTDQVAKRIERGEIEIAPLAFMRGRTLARAYIILDEAQNTTPVQMKMFLTRLGEGGYMAITGDLSQIDLPRGTPSGLAEALKVLQNVDHIGMTHFTSRDVVRHPLVTRVLNAYAAFEDAPPETSAPKQKNRGKIEEAP